ncbi:hypothetical protein V5G24_22950, partial [Xanthobacter sp. VTT E-85241]|uniref:hypothetical protein n=1 Tax=Roseixanthobacter finlandensis TaxID=3119922 RepID=UPI003729439A
KREGQGEGDPMSKPWPLFALLQQALQDAFKPGLDPACRIDFAGGSAPTERVLRPSAANTQCGYVLRELAAGRRVSSASIFRSILAVKPTNRISEVRRLLRSHGIEMRHDVKRDNGKRYYVFFLDIPDQDRAAELIRSSRQAGINEPQEGLKGKVK